MSTQFNLAAVMLVMTLHGQVYAGRIFGGHEVVPHSRPYMVLVERFMENGATLYCGGFLLNEDFVMTAAHCLSSSYIVRLGVHDAAEENENVQQIEVKQSFPHAGFNKKGFINDVMLLKLGSKAKFNNNVKPIQLAAQDDKTLPSACIVCGWGLTDNTTEKMSSKLMEVNITLISNINCEKENSYCSVGVNGPRPGDSGGPLVCEDMAYGVVSAMLNSSEHILYRYSKIPDYTAWTVSIIKNNND